MQAHCFAVMLAAVGGITTPPPLSSAPFPEGVSDEAAYASWLDAQSAALAALADPTASIPLAKHLGYRANWIMSYRCEPLVSRAVLGTALPDDAERLAAHTVSARVDLERAAAVPDLPFEIQDDLEFLMGINQAMEYYAEAQRGAVEADKILATTTALAVWLDDDRDQVADSARLWQGLLFRATGQFDRALRSFPSAVESLSDSRSAFFVRALRCLVHADRGQFSLAAALLLKMEERCAQWFDSTSDVASAELTLVWMRTLVAQGDERPRRELTRKLKDQRLERMRKDLEEDKETGLLRLHPAVPLVIESNSAPPLSVPTPVPDEEREVREVPD